MTAISSPDDHHEAPPRIDTAPTLTRPICALSRLIQAISIWFPLSHPFLHQIDLLIGDLLVQIVLLILL